LSVETKTAVLGLGTIAVAVLLAGCGGTKQQTSEAGPQVLPDPAAMHVARRFATTAVARRNLHEAYELAGPQIRQGESLRTWLTGNIAVTPDPLGASRFVAAKVDFASHDREQVELSFAREAFGAKPQVFVAQLVKVRKRWLVDGWVPRVTGGVPPAS